jgi:hypothetical protein
MLDIRTANSNASAQGRSPKLHRWLPLGPTQGRRVQYTHSNDSLTGLVAGLGSLYRGVAPKLTQSVLGAAILFASKEKIYQFLKRALAERAKATA